MDHMEAIPGLMGDGIEGKSCGLELLHPPELVHRVLQPSDLVVVEEKKSEAGQMIEGPRNRLDVVVVKVKFSQAAVDGTTAELFDLVVIQPQRPQEVES